jgi:hypothetical protein
MASFLIQTVKFEFKYNTWINQEPPPSYNPIALAVGGTAPPGSNAAATDRSGRPIVLQVKEPTTSA